MLFILLLAAYLYKYILGVPSILKKIELSKTLNSKKKSRRKK